MRFGILLDGGHLPEQPRAQILAERLEKARAAKRHGFHCLWMGQGYLTHTWHPTVLLARVVAEAPDMDYGMISLLPLQHPVELAEQVATLDVICGGRFTLAPALGWRPFQYRAFEVPREERLPRFLEILEVLKLLWTQERVTYHGRYFHLEDVPGASRTLQQPYPRIWIAANQDAGVRRAARTADGWLISSRSTLPTIRRQAALYRAAAEEAGREGHISAWREMYVARDRKAAEETIRPYVEWLYRDRAALGHDRDLPATDRIDVPFQQVLEGRFIIGSPEECAQEIRKYQEVGVEEVIMRVQWPGMPGEDSLKAIALFGEEVLPQFT